MPRKPASPATVLGAAVQRKRDGKDLRAVAAELGLGDVTLSRVERGAHLPSPRTARALATWLGWTVGEVFDAAEAPAPSSDAPGVAKALRDA